MGENLTDRGEESVVREYFQGDVFNSTTVELGLFDDSTLDAGDTVTESDIQPNEPGGASYSRQTIDLVSAQFDVVDNTSGNFESRAQQESFDLSDSNGSIDSYFFLQSFNSQESGVAGHVILTGDLSQQFNIDQIDTFRPSDAGFSLD